jgi:membrane protein implicated in regulation of membrane protease activity
VASPPTFMIPVASAPERSYPRVVAIPGIIYLAALIFGIGIQALQFVMAGADADADVDADADFDVDAEADLATGVDHEVLSHGGADHDAGGFLPILLSVRFWTFGALAFGLSGSLLHFLQLAPATVTLIVAVSMGLVSGYLASWVFRHLAQSTTTSGAGEAEAVGQVGRVLVPVKRGARGKVRIQLRGQTADYLALSDDGDFEEGEDVLVTEVEDGQVRVARAPAEFLRPRDD